MIDIGTPEGRRAGAFAAILGGCITMTVFAAVGVYIVSGNARYSFYLALAAHLQVLIGLTAFSAQLIKRTIRAGRDGFEIRDDVQQVEVVNTPSQPVPTTDGLDPTEGDRA